MEFRRNGHRDERRRRVLIEDRRGATIRREPGAAKSRRSDSDDERAASRCAGYSAAAHDGQQLPVTCLIPKRPWTMSVLVLSGLTLVVGVQFLYTNVFQTASRSQQAVLSALNVSAPGSLMGWISSLFLLIAAAGALMVYAIRRHRLDDYRGRYRLWLWCVLACGTASIDAATGLHRALGQALSDVARTPLYGDGAIWWLLVFGVVFGTGMVRLLIEVRGSFLAVLGIVLAGAGYVSGAMIELNLLLAGWGAFSLLVQFTCVMLAHLGIAVAVLAYCRYVHRAAQLETSTNEDASQDNGEEAPRRSRKRTRRQTSTVRVDDAHETPTAKSQSQVESEETVEFTPQIDEEDATKSERRLSKSERRRLRKESRRNRRSA